MGLGGHLFSFTNQPGGTRDPTPWGQLWYPGSLEQSGWQAQGHWFPLQVAAQPLGHCQSLWPREKEA